MVLPKESKGDSLGRWFIWSSANRSGRVSLAKPTLFTLSTRLNSFSSAAQQCLEAHAERTQTIRTHLMCHLPDPHLGSSAAAQLGREEKGADPA